VCLEIGQKNYSYEKKNLVKKCKKSIENVMGIHGAGILLQVSRNLIFLVILVVEELVCLK
jgi:hypothetical protein